MAIAQVNRLEWGRELAAGIDLAAGSKDDGEAIAADVRDNYAQGWRIESHEGTCYVVVRVEYIGQRRECVVVAAQGRGLATVADMIYSAAAAAGCHRIRFHTKRPAVARLIARKYRVEHVEHVYAISIGNNDNG